MKILCLKPLLLAGCALAVAAPLLATPLQRADIAADPAWVVHVDFDAARATAVGQFIVSQMDKPEVQAHFEVFQSLFSFDPRKQLHAVSLYGVSNKPEDGV